MFDLPDVFFSQRKPMTKYGNKGVSPQPITTLRGLVAGHISWSTFSFLCTNCCQRVQSLGNGISYESVQSSSRVRKGSQTRSLLRRHLGDEERSRCRLLCRKHQVSCCRHRGSRRWGLYCSSSGQGLSVLSRSRLEMSVRERKSDMISLRVVCEGWRGDVVMCCVCAVACAG